MPDIDWSRAGLLDKGRIILFFLLMVASIINMATLYEVKGQHEKLFMAQLLIIAAIMSGAWSAVSLLGDDGATLLGQYGTYFVGLVIIAVSSANLSVKDDIEKKVSDWQYQFFVYTNWIMIVWSVVQLLTVGGHHAPKAYGRAKNWYRDRRVQPYVEQRGRDSEPLLGNDVGGAVPQYSEDEERV